jgi:hypothetical protein
MGRSAFSRMRTRVARCCALSTLAACAALVVVGASPAPAAHNRTDTFSGSCDLAGKVWWPDQPLTVAPVDIVMDARQSGECSGTLNGRDIQSAPAVAVASVRGLQWCGSGDEKGRFRFKVAGRTITGAMTYQRVGPRAAVLWQGDGGGQAVIEVHALIGVVGQDDPLAATPVVGPLISGPVTDEEAVKDCGGQGISELPVATEAFHTVPSLSG